ncbi:MAG TPA: DUF3015 family protein [Thermodesulfobacteriota bacterium]
MRKLAMLASAVVLLGLGVTNADAANLNPSTYGTAGCGLGSLIFQDEPGLVQVLAATTNGTFGNQTFGITTGTLNCVDRRSTSRRAALFVEANREALVKDVSRGSGETLVGLSAIMGCSDTKAVATSLQSNFSTIFLSEPSSTDQVTDAILETIRADKAVASTCTQLL